MIRWLKWITKLIYMSIYVTYISYLWSFYCEKDNSNTYRCSLSYIWTLVEVDENGSTYRELYPIIHTPSHPHRHFNHDIFLSLDHTPNHLFTVLTLNNQYLLYLEEPSASFFFNVREIDTHACNLCTYLYFFQFIIPFYC